MKRLFLGGPLDGTVRDVDGTVCIHHEIATDPAEMLHDPTKYIFPEIDEHAYTLEGWHGATGTFHAMVHEEATASRIISHLTHEHVEHRPYTQEEHST